MFQVGVTDPKSVPTPLTFNFSRVQSFPPCIFRSFEVTGRQSLNFGMAVIDKL